MSELTSRLRTGDGADPAMSVGGLALAAAAAVGFSRMQDSWAAFPLFLLIALPCLALFALALLPGRDGAPAVGSGGRLAGWQSAYLLAGLLLLAASLQQLIEVVGADPGNGSTTVIAVIIGVLAATFGTRLDSPGSTLFSALAFAIAGIVLVQWFDNEAPAAAFRDAFLIEGILFLAAAQHLRAKRLEHAHLLVSVAGLVFIIGAVIGIIGAVNPFAELVSGGGGGDVSGADGWKFLLIAVSLGLLAYAAWQRYRGSAFVGLLGLLVFFATTVEGTLIGWPLFLLVVAVAAIGWSLYGDSAKQGGGADSPA